MGSSPFVARLLCLLALLAFSAPVRAEDPPGPGSPDGEEAAPPHAPSAASGTPSEGDPAGPRREDVVYLANGGVFSGRVVRDDGDVVVIEVRSDRGGLGRYTFEREQVERIERRSGDPEPTTDTRPVRDEWFLLQSAGRVVGTRHLELWSIRDDGQPAYRLEEEITTFAQGAHIPAVRVVRTEVTDLRFTLRLATWREMGEASLDPAGPGRYERSASGRVRDGVWYGTWIDGAVSRAAHVAVPAGTRGRLGLREHLLRRTQAVGLATARILDPEKAALREVRAGFTATLDGERGAEFLWEDCETGERLFAVFPAAGTTPSREQIRVGLEAVLVSARQAAAARREAEASPDTVAEREVSLPLVGLAFELPDAVWRWSPRLDTPTNTGWRVLGTASHPTLVADMRIEWHPHEPDTERGEERVEAWLLQRLRGVSPDLAVSEPRAPVLPIREAWRIELAGTVKGTDIRTLAVVVERPEGRAVLLLACPATGWEAGRQAFERFLSSLRLL